MSLAEIMLVPMLGDDIPSNAIVDENGEPIVDENGEYIIDPGA